MENKKSKNTIIILLIIIIVGLIGFIMYDKLLNNNNEKLPIKLKILKIVIPIKIIKLNKLVILMNYLKII